MTNTVNIISPIESNCKLFRGAGTHLLIKINRTYGAYISRRVSFYRNSLSYDNDVFKENGWGNCLQPHVGCHILLLFLILIFVVEFSIYFTFCGDTVLFYKAITLD